MLAQQVYHTAFRISYRDSDISLEIAAFYNTQRRVGFMSENKLLDLLVVFALRGVLFIFGGIVNTPFD